MTPTRTPLNVLEDLRMYIIQQRDVAWKKVSLCKAQAEAYQETWSLLKSTVDHIEKEIKDYLGHTGPTFTHPTKPEEQQQ